MADIISMTTPRYGGGDLSSFSMLSSAPGPRVMAGDFLRLNATTTDSSGTLNCNGRLLDMTGEIKPFSLSLTFSGTGNQTSTTVPLTDGWIIGFDVFVASGTVSANEVVASVEVVQGAGTPATRVMCLASGDVTNTRQLGLGAYVATGGGFAAESATFVLDAFANPNPGDDMVATVPAGQTWELLEVKALLTASATVASRIPYLYIGSAFGLETIYFVPGAVTASQAVRFSFAPDASGFIVSGVYGQGSFAQRIFLPPAAYFQLGARNFQADDVLTLGFYSARVWPS